MRRQEIQDFARLPEGGWTQINFAWAHHIPLRSAKRINGISNAPDFWSLG